MKILIIFIAGIFSTNLVFAEIRPYFEGQMNYIDPDDVSTDPSNPIEVPIIDDGMPRLIIQIYAPDEVLQSQPE